MVHSIHFPDVSIWLLYSYILSPGPCTVQGIFVNSGRGRHYSPFPPHGSPTFISPGNCQNYLSFRQTRPLPLIYQHNCHCLHHGHHHHHHTIITFFSSLPHQHQFHYHHQIKEGGWNRGEGLSGGRRGVKTLMQVIPLNESGKDKRRMQGRKRISVWCRGRKGED